MPDLTQRAVPADLGKNPRLPAGVEFSKPVGQSPDASAESSLWPAGQARKVLPWRLVCPTVWLCCDQRQDNNS